MKIALIILGVVLLVIVGVVLYGIISWLRQDQP
jgi:hypothetical protein